MIATTNECVTAAAIATATALLLGKIDALVEALGGAA